MPSQSVSNESSRRRAEGQFKSKKKADAQGAQADTTARRAEAEKTARLRALRLAKEAADKDAANRKAAALALNKPQPRRRVPRSRVSEPT
ncbi:MAG TPA: hypothetical protein VNV18_14735 [Stellaceae bacterium]|jgi:hypothetical protein|nr:hypothetical protein [Stellaceae bacterium]